MLKQIYLDFPDEESYKLYLLKIRWSKNVICPFCGSCKNSKLLQSHKFHCNSCNTNFSITVNTVMHNSKIELRKWLAALYLFLKHKNLSYRKLSLIIDVNKKTAHRMIGELHFLFLKNRLLILKIAGSKKGDIEIMSRMLLMNIRGRS